LLKAQSQFIIKPTIITDRPDQTESPFIVPQKNFQIETGFVFQHDRVKEEEIDEDQILYPTSLLKYGVSENFEIRLVIENMSVLTKKRELKSQKFGFNPVQLGFKARVFKEKKMLPETSFIFHLGFPDLASSNFKTQYLSQKFRVTCQHNLTKNWYLSYNFGIEWNGESAKNIKIYTLTTGTAISSTFAGYIEVYGFLPIDEKKDHRLNGGLTYNIKPNFMVDASVGIGLSKISPNMYLGLGCSLRLPN
jgi:hypothetical protein